MSVSQIMSRPVVTVGMDTRVEEMRDLFSDHSFHHLIVVEHGKAVGVISDRDLLKNLSPFLGKMAERASDVACLQRRAHQIMTRRLVSITPDTPLHEACQLMHRYKVSCLPVLDEKAHPVGIVTIRDVMRWAAMVAACVLDPQFAEGHHDESGHGHGHHDARAA